MGDHRASIKIEMTFHGKKEESDWWINYWPDDDGVDARIKNWFREKYEEGMNRHYAEELKYKIRDAAIKAKEDEVITARELAELDRLKQKYE